MSALLPIPRNSSLGPATAPADVDIVETHDSGLPAEGYALRITDRRVDLAYADDAGHRYGLDTLEALRDTATGTLPHGEVSDWPDFPIRGYMLDVSRDRVPTRETLAWLVDLLAAVRINHLELYTEHTFAYRDHEVVWRDASPLTPDDLRWLDGLTATRNIELVANQNCFGHFERWLRHPEYLDRAEAPDGWRMPVLDTAAPPATLEPTPANAEFALSLVRELTAGVRSRRVNVGCDETFELGMGRSRALVEARGRADVFVEHLRRIILPLADDGFEVWFWGDMVRRRPDLLAGLPPEHLRALVWNYEAPSGEGAPGMSDLVASVPELAEVFELPPDAALGFRAHARAFAEAGFPFLLAPGTSSWNSLLGRWTNARENLLDAVDTGRALGAHGVLITDWGDNGHMQPLAVSVPAIVLGGAAAWCAETNRDIDVARHVDELLGDATGQVGETLLRLGDCHSRTGRQTVNGSPIFMALFEDAPLPAWGTAEPAGVAAVLADLEDALGTVSELRLDSSQGDAVRDELAAAIRLARHGAWRIEQRAGLASRPPAEMLADLDEAIALQRTAWLARSRPGGLDDSVGRLEPTRREYEKAL